jgi:hypothetical protein
MFASFRDYAASIRTPLNTSLTAHLAQVLGDTPAPQSGEALQLLTHGKKARGSLLCLVTAALGGTLESALPRAAAVELIQTATLIHDDFVDQHTTRRGAPALWTIEGARKAVLLGDVLFASAIRMMSELGRAEGQIVSQAIAEISRGAYQEPLDQRSLVDAIEAGLVNAALYEKIVRLKTGVLFGAACQLGALAAHAGAAVERCWQRYGLRIGEAYQIADDLHEVERHLLAPAVDGGDLAALAPALLFFTPSIQPSLIEAARRDSSSVDGALRSHFETARQTMSREVEVRLRAAVAEIEDRVPENGYARLTRETPWGLIEMFNGATPAASGPRRSPQRRTSATRSPRSRSRSDSRASRSRSASASAAGTLAARRRQ